MSTFKTKLKKAWRSRTIWAGLLFGVLTGAQPQILALLKMKLDEGDYAIAGVIVFAVIAALRWVTTQPLDQKGGQK